MDVSAYLDRIGASVPAALTSDTLTELHEAHMGTVPFENLDIPLGREIVMDEGRFLDKVVRQKRGGFCYELNGVFAWLLRALGFDASYLSARVVGASGEPGPDFDHMALLVDVAGEAWIADVGFGDSFRSPLRLVSGDVQRDSDPRGIVYRFTDEAGIWSMWKSDPAEVGWSREYVFTLEPRRLDQYAAMCRHQQVSPDSSFTRKVVCSRTTPDGRNTLTATTLIETSADGRTETAVRREDWYDVLRERFGVVLPAEITRWP